MGRRKWPENAEDARQEAIATYRRIQQECNEAMELLKAGKAIPVAVVIHKINSSAQRGIETLKEAKYESPSD